MTLQYKILWFEDEKDWMEPLVQKIKDYVESLGFYFVKPHYEEDSANTDTINYSDYDLVLMDYKLSGDDKGDVIIQKIRSSQFYTDIVFYSASEISTLRSSLVEKGVDGVYCAPRAQPQFLQTVQNVISATVRKVLDPNNIRGLVMAEVSDFDEKMIEIISLFLNSKLQDDSNKFLAERKRKLIGSLKGKLKEIEEIELQQLTTSRDFDASHKYRAVRNIVKMLGNNTVSACLDFYKSEIIDVRNDLAHAKMDSKKQQLMVGSIAFDDAFVKQIMLNIIKHRNNFSEIIRLLQKQ